MCRWHYDNYWNGTIYRVQTVDFNILHHTLPSTLSQLIIAGRDQELQRVLDSTYGIFGLVITDPAGKEILYRTSNVYKRESWQKYLSVDYLGQDSEPFDLLSDPPPLSVQFYHASPRKDKAESAGAPPSGRILGRLYYVRGVPPGYGEDLLGAVFSNWFEMSGSKRGYIFLTLIVVGFSVSTVMLLLYRKRSIEMKALELDSKEQELGLKRKALVHLTADLQSQRQRKEWLEQESELSYQRALRLKEELMRIREAFFFVDASPGGQNAQPGQPVNVRPPMHNASQLIGEIESIIPELTHNAKVLRSHAEVWQSYCAQLESRERELRRLLQERQSSGQAQVSYAPPENQPQNISGSSTTHT